MRVFLFALGLALSSLADASAQTVSSKIMDANLTWTQSGNQYAGTVHVYLTDTLGIAGLQVSLGTQPDTADLHIAQYTIGTGGSFYSTGTIDANNVLHLPIGTYAHHQDYYAKLSVLLDGGGANVIEVHSSN